VDKERLPDELPIQPSFRHITNILLSHDYDENKTYDFFRKDVKNEFDEKRLRRRITLAKNWLQRHAPDDFKFVVREQVPQELKESLSDKQKKAVKGVLDLVDSDISTEKLEYEIFEVAKKLDMGFKEFFTTFYRILIDKKRGPKLASFIEEIGRDKVKKLLNQVLD
jgi:lysyl-tRNA synthetase class 1